MKKIFLVGIFCVGLLPGSLESFSMIAQQQETGVDSKAQIAYKDLPQAIREHIESDLYKGWKVQEPIFLVQIHNLEFYEIRMKSKSGEVRVLKMDKDGRDLN